MILQRTALLLALLTLHGTWVAAEEEDDAHEEAHQDVTTPTQPSAAAATLGTLFRQARSEHYYNAGGSAARYGEEAPVAAARADPYEPRDSAYFESRCITCDPSKAAAPTADREPYPGRWRQRGKYDYYDEEYDDRRYRNRYYNDDYYNDRARAPAYDYGDRYDPHGRNELFRPAGYADRYSDPNLAYDRDSYYGGRPVDRQPVDRPLVDPGLPRPLIDRPADRPVDRPLIDRPYDRGYNDRGYNDRGYNDRGNGYDNLDSRYPYDERYNDRYVPPKKPYDEYGPPRFDRFNANRNYGRYEPVRYDGRYEPYDRNFYRRPPPPPAYDDRYDRYGGGGGGRLPPPDSRGYYGSGSGGGWPAPGAADRPAYASAWNYNGGGGRESWRDVNRDRERDRDRDRDRDSGFYRPRDYFYDSTAAPGGSRGTSYLYDRPESSTKPDADKPTNSPQTQEANKTYKD